jgi:hypothetical protein
MVAQNFSTPTADGYSDGNPLMIPETLSGVEDELSSENIPTDVLTETPTDHLMDEDGIGVDEEGMEEEAVESPGRENGGTLTDFIFKKLESFGYPGRRLEEFKKKFIKENISPDGTKDIKVEIPDKYYPDEMGNIKTVETEELSSIVSEMSDTFGLNFNGAERSEGKWTINLTSARKDDNPEDQIETDNLDDVYGPSGSKGSKKKKIKAFSMSEMINASKSESLIENLKRILGDKNAS